VIDVLDGDPVVPPSARRFHVAEMWRLWVEAMMYCEDLVLVPQVCLSLLAEARNSAINLARRPADMKPRFRTLITEHGQLRQFAMLCCSGNVRSL